MHKNILNKLGFSIIILTPFLSSCSSGNNQFVEIISPPTLSDDFSSIPDATSDPQLKKLSSADEIIQTLRYGRSDPFLPPNIKKDQLLVPPSFKYLGQIASKNVINAFVSYKNRSGLIKPGDIGGKNTDLLPPDWLMEDLNIDTQVLTLSFQDSYLKLNLFDEK
tara:strand:+ start:561 stop:1052 length:492 start_codon:yes stop_codon:yes gene_type:complete